ncbi:MAG: ATP-dependent DNA helicase RecG [Pirellulaceae bacterium]|nr:ATP-dependent DNA helicase RecG [Planctomycetales bacterium]
MSREMTTPVQYLKGVGPDRQPLLEKLGLKVARDLIFFFPRTYQQVSTVRSVRDVEEGQTATLQGVIEEVGAGDTWGSILVRQGEDYIRAVWFNQPFMVKRFQRGQTVALTGVVKRQQIRWEMRHPKADVVEPQDIEEGRDLLPVYPLTEGLKQSQIRRIVKSAVEEFLEQVEEVLPERVIEEHELLSIHQAISQIHWPEDEQQLQRARHRLVFQELLVLQLALAMRRHATQSAQRAMALPGSTRIDARIRRLFPFSFTACQEQAIREIGMDLSRTVPMNRLLQGDVGTGKTIVATYAMLVAVANGAQAALMVPNEVLAQQHLRTLNKALTNAHVRIGLLTGGASVVERRQFVAAAGTGELDIVIGTHAILQNDVQFANLGLVVIDEQHKFGVRQRAQLRASGEEPHYLVMTATPIPRTVAMTEFGDLEISTLRTVPPGRQNVYTYIAESSQREQWWDFFRKKLSEGRQGFVVTPVIDGADYDGQPDIPPGGNTNGGGRTNDSDSGSGGSGSETETCGPPSHLVGVEQTYERLANGELEAYCIDVLHGRMSATEKAHVMQKFVEGETQVLIATSVVEVGIDVPNATLMTIENGERFGLAQLHQMRGRVRRGAFPGYVCIFHDAQTPAALDRLMALETTADGFELAEIDYRLRGPGDLMGTRQHGLPPLRIADLTRDGGELALAREVARRIVENDPDLQADDMARLRRMVLVRYAHALELANVG